MGNVVIWHILGRNEYIVSAKDGKERRHLNGKPEARWLSANRGWPIEKISPEDWDLNLKTWAATDAAHQVEPVLAATEDQAIQAVKDLFAKGATVLSIRAIQADPTVRSKAGVEALKAAMTAIKEQHPDVQVIEPTTPETPATPPST